MNSKKILPCGALAAGSLIALIGIGLAATYVSEAIIARLGEADQSLLFWYLPILFMGVIGIVIGVVIGVLGVIRLRQIREQNSTSEN
jgi:NhaP-type Na+/H+ or K+/H+ antiporter